MSKPLILVVDDEPYIAELLSELLADELDCQVEIAYNGIQGLSLAKKSHPSLIITDLMMPHMDGQSFVNQLREKPDLRNIPILIMSAARHCPQWVRDEGYPFIAKPFEPEDLLNTVASLLRHE